MSYIYVKDVSILEIFDYLKNELEKEIQLINEVIKKYESENELRGILFGDYQVIGEYPAITIGASGEDINWIATDATQQNVFNLIIMCYVKNLAREETEKYIVEFGETIRKILTHPSRLRFKTSDGVVWDSIVGRIDFGTIKGGSVKACRLSYTAKSWTPIGIVKN